MGLALGAGGMSRGDRGDCYVRGLGWRETV